jgi:MYXO-CTERM domain-containing protein
MKTYRATNRFWLLAAAPALLLASSPARADRADDTADRAAIARITRVPTIDLCDHGRGHKHCMAKVVADAKGAPIRTPLASAIQGFVPADLHSAYALPTTGGKGKTVAVVDAYDAPNAETDLGTYRAQFNLPACTTANGCFKKVSQTGDTNYPPTDGKGADGWEGEIMLDVEMISAVCPDCNILLVETNDDQTNSSFEAALTTAAKLGASAISNSYGGDEDDTVSGEEAYYDQPGILVTASAGDSGYGASYPATSAYVLAVGGTSLAKSGSTRGWAETAWAYAQGGGTGSGCSGYIAKPSYQKDPDCNMRMEADVSAVADPATGVATYDAGQWEVVGGTSASSPIVASSFVLLGLEKAGIDFAYKNPSAFFDITSGSNDPQGGTACNSDYQCVAMAGFDGPTGWGTPNGTALIRFLPPTTPDAGVDSGTSGKTGDPPGSGDAGVTSTSNGGSSSGGGSSNGGASSSGSTDNSGGADDGSSSGGGTTNGTRGYNDQLPAAASCACAVPGTSEPLGKIASLIALGAVGIVARRRRRH